MSELAWSKAEQLKYKQEAQKKEADIVKAVSNQMRDAVRVSLMEAGDIDLKYGYLAEAYRHYAK